MAVNKFNVPVVDDNQIFEYSDILSLAIDDKQAHLNPGQPVVINKENGIAGILQSKVAPKDGQAYDSAYAVMTKPTYGLNGPGYASVRVKGGVFELMVKVSPSEDEAGGPVYLKAATGAGVQPEITTTKANGDVVLGWLKEASPVLGTSAETHKCQVVLAPAKIA
nr:MAG TPA: hypothetical protein [Caudoviricetes sp.]